MKKSSMAFVAGMTVAALMIVSLVVLAAAQTSGGNGAAPAQSATTGGKAEAQPQGSPVAEPTNKAGNGVSNADIIRYYNLYMQSLAANLGVSQDKLTSSMNQAAKDTVNQAVKDGKLTQAQADEISSQWPNMQMKLFAAGMMAGGDKGQCPATPQSDLENQVNDAAFQALAAKLGMGVADVKQALGSGKSVADLAASKNVSVQEIKIAVINAIKPILDQAVRDGTINQQQEDTLIQTVQNADLSKPISALTIGGGAAGKALDDTFLRQVMEQSFQSVADRLGMTKDQLMQQLGQGKSLADIAASKNVSQAELKTAIANGIKPVLDQGVKDGKISQQQEDAILQGVQSMDLTQNPKDLLRPLAGNPKMCQ